MLKWEYWITEWIKLETKLTDHTLNDYGEKGWELASTVRSGKYIRHYFKRPILDKPKVEEPK